MQTEEADSLPELTPEEANAVLSRYASDFEFYTPRILKVLTMEGKIELMQLNAPQRILHKTVEQIIASGRPLRMVALKARRMGFSTYFSARNFHHTSWNFNRFATQVTHEPEASDTLFKMVKRFYNNTPEWLQPSTKYNNTKLLEFDTKDGKGLGSGFRVATAGKEDFGSGQLLHRVHLSELSKWEANNVESLLTSILQCVPDDMDTEVAIESTAKGIGGEFYDRFWEARYRIWVTRLDLTEEERNSYELLTADRLVESAVIDEKTNEDTDELNIYTSFFLPWYCFEKYQFKPYPGFEEKLTKEEIEIRERYGLTLPQLYWRRMTIANKCKGSVDTFNQEYPSNPTHAFLGSGRPVFDNNKVLKAKEAAPAPIARYECLTGMQQWIAKEDGRLQVWEEPKRGRSYIISADVAEGVHKGDFSVADVIDHFTGKQVAHWHGRIDPDQFAVVLMCLGRRYNEGLIAPERNNHGLTVVTVMVNEGYPKVYAEMVPEPPGKPRKRYGWATTSATRPLIIDNLVSEIREGTHGIQSVGTFDEMMSFKIQDNGRMEADSGRHDDRVISIAIGKYVRNVMPLPRPTRAAHLKDRGKRGTSRKPPTKGWT